MRISEIMTTDVQTVEPDASIEEAAQRMADADVGLLPVLARGRVEGLLTDRDIVVRVVSEGLDAGATTVADVMTQEVVHCYEDQDVEHMRELMDENRLRRLVVLRRDGRLAGIASLSDLAHERTQGGHMRKKGSAGGGPLGSLVRGELSAVETYRQALEKIGDESGGSELRRIENEHEEAVSLLQEHMTQLGVEPPADSGLWGSFAKAVEGSAKVLGNKAAIKALKEGEEHGIKDYEAALEDETVDPEIKELISANLLPRTRAHLPVLDRFLESGSEGTGGA